MNPVSFELHSYFCITQEAVKVKKVKVAQLCPTVCDPHGLYSPWNSPGQNTGVGSLSFLQGIFPTQGLNPGLPYCRRILYQLSHKEAEAGPHSVDEESETRKVWWFAQDHTMFTVRNRTRFLLLHLMFLCSKVHHPFFKMLKSKQKQQESIFIPNLFGGRTSPVLTYFGNKNLFWDAVKIFIILLGRMFMFYYRNFNVFNYQVSQTSILSLLYESSCLSKKSTHTKKNSNF